MIERFVGARKARRVYRFIHQSKVTFFCLFLTVVVLRGTIGAGKFGTPEQDLVKIRNFYSRRLGEHHRVFEEVKSSSSIRLGIKVANTTNYTAFNYKKFIARDGEEEHEYNGVNAESGRDPPYYSQYLGTKILDWDKQRAKWLRKSSKFPNVDPRTNKPRVLLVSGSSSKPCENPLGNHYLLKSVKNKMDYCRLHGIEVFYDMVVLEAEMSGFRAKLHLLRVLLLAHPEVEFLWWMDSDALFTDMRFELPWASYAGYNLVMHNEKEMNLEQENWIGLKTGSFLIRNTQWSLDLVDAWALIPRGKINAEEEGLRMRLNLKDKPVLNVDDHSAVVYLLKKDRAVWSRNVYLENANYLHVYQGVLVDKDRGRRQSGRSPKKWPLITHFDGCKPCGKGRDYPFENCAKLMEIAFDAADNQIMNGYAIGMRLPLSSRGAA